MERILELLDGVPELPEEQIYWMIDHACRVDKIGFKVVVILLAVIAILASTFRLLFRYRAERTLHLEDYLILFATICLIAETGLVYSFSMTLYYIDAATMNLPVLKFLSQDNMLTDRVLSMGPSTLVAYFTLGWVTIFAIKFSFLALFFKMLRGVNIRTLRAYFWCTVAATGMAGVVVVLESFILCPKFGANAAQCFLKNSTTFSLSTGVVVQLLDIITDLMIISIPIALLRVSRLQLDRKLRIAIVLCLSSICIILSVVRLAGGLQRNVFGNLQFSTAWISFMLHCEAAVAVMAGSIPALRAIVSSRRNRKSTGASGTSNESTEKFEFWLSWKEKGDRLWFSTKEKAGSLFERSRRGRTKETLPQEERQARAKNPWPQSSMAKMRYSLAAFMPHRAANHPPLPPAASSAVRNDSADSGVIHPGIAYHHFRQEEVNQITITYECTVESESHRSLDLSEAASHAGAVISAPSSPRLGMAFPEPAVTSRRVDRMIDEQFGQISAGIHI